MKKPSAESELRRLRRDYRLQGEALMQARRELVTYRGRSTKAEQEVAGWRAWFDKLLDKLESARVAVKP